MTTRQVRPTGSPPAFPTARQPGGDSRALDAADRNPTTARPEDTLGVVAAQGAFDPVVVVTESGVVLGLLTQDELRGHPAEVVENVMRPGPTTVRAHEPLRPLLERMYERNVDLVIVTTPGGDLLGVIRNRDTTSR